jgi:tetratricopeptide (TPR) repeat protein
VTLISNQTTEDDHEIEEFSVSTDGETLTTQNETQLQAAIALSQSGSIEEAMSIYTDILTQNSHHQVAAVNLALLTLKHTNCDEALKTIHHAVSVSRGTRLAKALALQGYCEIQSGEFQRAQLSLSRSIEFRPNHSLTWRRLAQAQMQSKIDGDTVLTTFKRSLALAPNNKNLRLSVARFQQRRLDFRGSIETIKEKYSVLKNLYSVQYLLAWNYIELGKWNNARKHINLAKKLDKSKIRLLTAMDLFTKKQYDQTIDYIKSGRKVNSTYRYLLAISFQEKNWKKTADKYFNRSKKLEAFSLRSTLRQIDMISTSLSKQQLNEQFSTVIQLGAIRTFPSYIVAKSLVKKGEYQEANAWLKELVYPNSLRAINNLYGSVLWNLGQVDQSLALLDSAIKEYPSHHKTIRQYSEYLLSHNEAEKAHELIKKFSASELYAKDFILLSNIHQALNDSVSAELTLKEGLEYWANNTDLRMKYAHTLNINNKRDQSIDQLNLVLKLDQTHEQAKQTLAEYQK